MGKLKNLLIEEDFVSLNGVSNDDIEKKYLEYWSKQ